MFRKNGDSSAQNQSQLKELDDARKLAEANALEEAISWNYYGKDSPQDLNGNTHMHQAVLKRNEHSIRKLLLQDASLKVTNKDSETPIAMAFRTNWTEGLEVLSQLAKDSMISENDKRILAKHRAIYDPAPAPRAPRRNPVKAATKRPALASTGTGMFAPVAAVKPEPMQVQSAQKPFMAEDIQTIKAFIERKKNDLFVMKLVEQIMDPIAEDVMSDPVYLQADQRIYDRETLAKIVPVNGQKLSPFNRAPFTDADIKPAIEAIQRIQIFLDLAINDLRQQENQAPTPMKM